MDKLKELIDKLEQARKEYDKAAEIFRDTGIEPHTNIERCCLAQGDIIKIELEIYKIRPDLKPDYLK